MSPLILQERCKADMLTLDMCDKRCCCRFLQRPHGRVGWTSCNWDRPHVHHSGADAISSAPPAEFIPPTSDASWPGFIRHFIRQQTNRRFPRRPKLLISLVGVAGFEPATPSERGALPDSDFSEQALMAWVPQSGAQWREAQPIRVPALNGGGTYCADFCASVVRFPFRLVRFVQGENHRRIKRMTGWGTRIRT